MSSISLNPGGPDDREGFWRQARGALAAGRSPQEVVFTLPSDMLDLLSDHAHRDDAEAALASKVASAEAVIEPALQALVDGMLLHSAADRFALAYRLLWRSQTTPALSAIASDPDVARAADLGKSVRRDMHKMKAFVRFREQEDDLGKDRYVAWFEPQHHIVRAVAPFFVGRFAGMRWSILTPECCAHWDGAALSFTPGARKSDAPQGDPLEEVWRTYYGSIFNPARLKIKAMTAQMPKKYWHNLPEAAMIAPLVRSAIARSSEMVEAPPTEARRRRPNERGAEVPKQNCGTLDTCTRCPLHQHATQVVPGEGPETARIMIVGEQPGDMEDLAGRPFVGPAGKLLNTALERVGIERQSCYLTNAVKHFKFEPRGKRRIHKSPSRTEIDQCRWWLDLERDRVKPSVIVAMGVSAVRGVTGTQMVLASIRSRPIALGSGTQMVATVHPAYLLRLTEQDQKRTEWRQFLADLDLARELASAA